MKKKSITQKHFNSMALQRANLKKNKDEIKKLNKIIDEVSKNENELKKSKA